MPIRHPSKWGSSEGQELLARLKAGKITPEDADKEAVRRHWYKRPVDSQRARKQFENYRPEEVRKHHGERLHEIRAGQKGSRGKIDSDLLELAKEVRAADQEYRELLEALGVREVKDGLMKVASMKNELAIAERKVEFLKGELRARQLSLAAGNIKSD